MIESNQLLFFFSALGAFNGFILSIYFAINAKTKNFTNYFLSLLLLVLSIRIIKSIFFYFNPHLSNIFIQIGLSACVLIGPFLFLYLKSYGNEKLNWKNHVLSYLTVITILGIFYPYVEHRAIWSRWIVCAIYSQWLIYIILSLKYLRPIFLKIKKRETLKRIDIWFLSIYFGVVVIWFSYSMAAYTSYIVGALSFTFVLYLIMLLLVFKTNSESTFFTEKEKYKNKEIDKETLDVIDQKLAVIIEKELFLNPNFSLEEAAKELKVTKHILSQYVNEVLGKSFSSLIKEYRIEKAKKLLETETNYTIENLGYDSGFNSKSAFFTAFKKTTGLTPAEYQKSYLK
ncbi:helix-turn-helix domain-containing protein [Flavobacterium piscisymbiosum]|uniref:Helix-turn-helix domain-containing protein n=1 Tax=Flavobacterium piscisymbiosum TaxID=2893753 RepID=A0ABS8MI63_9FLAO|nr:helix-turn-helix domain-containing protein [Flavobacterium sp. F-30]MCC9065188.1 helix-turn-helix domain-containing protein [Flavobacterium sp. F-30]